MKILIFILSLVIVFTISCGGNGSNPTPSNPNLPPPNTGLAKTPQGINLKLTVPLDEHLQTELDSSLTKLFSDVSARNYSRMLLHSDYTITIKSDCIDRNGIMAWLQRLDSYDGTDFDQDPREGIGMIYVPEQVTLSPNRAPEFIICMDNVATMRSTSRYGAEHIILYYNDRTEYTRTAIHTTTGHPIIPIL